MCRICKPGDKLHVVWVTTMGGDYDDAALQMYKDAMHEAKVHSCRRFCLLWLPSVSWANWGCLSQAFPVASLSLDSTLLYCML